MKTISRPTPDQLALAIEEMAIRYGAAMRDSAYAVDAWARGRTDRAEVDRWHRTCDRRFRAIQRLTEALRKQADA